MRHFFRIKKPVVKAVEWKINKSHIQTTNPSLDRKLIYEPNKGKRKVPKRRTYAY